MGRLLLPEILESRTDVGVESGACSSLDTLGVEHVLVVIESMAGT